VGHIAFGDEKSLSSGGYTTDALWSGSVVSTWDHVSQGKQQYCPPICLGTEEGRSNDGGSVPDNCNGGVERGALSATNEGTDGANGERDCSENPYRTSPRAGRHPQQPTGR